MSDAPKYLLALDVGERRIGVAIANSIAKIPSPLTTIEVSDNIITNIQTIIDEKDIKSIVCGVPRGLNGQDTEQTKQTLEFINKLRQYLKIPIYTQDEAVTSHKAEEELKLKDQAYKKSDIDKLSAVYILEDYLGENDV